MFHVIRGDIWYTKQDFDKAIADYTEAIRLEPQMPNGHIARGAALGAKREVDKALVDLSQAIRLDPELDRAYSYRSWVWYWQGNYRNALADYRKATQLDPKSADYQNALAWFLATCPDARYRSGREAIAVATKACQLSDWKNAAIIDTLACALAETGQFDAAIARMQQALRQVHSSDDASFKLYEARLAQFKEHRPYRELPSAHRQKE